MFVSSVNDTGNKKKKFWGIEFFLILLSALYTYRLNFSLFLIFRCRQANIDRTLLSHGQNIYRQFCWHWWTVLDFLVISDWYQQHWGTPAINCSPVSTTLPINFSTGDKLYWRHRSVLSAKLSPAAEVDHGCRYCHWERTAPWPEAPEAAKTTLNQNGII